MPTIKAPRLIVASSTRLAFEVMADDKFEDEEAETRAGGEASMEQPEGGGRHRLVEAADPADHGVGGEEGQIIKADDGGVDRFGRILREEDETDRQEMGEGDAVDDVKGDRPEEPYFVAQALGGGGGDDAERAADGKPEPMMSLVT